MHKGWTLDKGMMGSEVVIVKRGVRAGGGVTSSWLELIRVIHLKRVTHDDLECS